MKLFFGSQWWCLTNESVNWIQDFISKHNEVCDFYRTTLVPDESFFQTLVMNVPYAEDIEPNLVYMDWSEGKNSPKVLAEEDFDFMIKSEKMIARKIDSRHSLDLYKRLLTIGT